MKWRLTHRHGELVVKQLLEAKDRAATRPGIDANEVAKEEDRLFDGDSVRRYRASAVKHAYLSQDRPGILYATKGCREMSSPAAGSWRGFKMIARVSGKDQELRTFMRQRTVTCIDSFGGAIWAGC